MRIIILVAALLAGCVSTPNRYEQEFQAYINLVNEEIRAGRITLAQGEYLVAQKRNQLMAQRESDQDRAMDTAARGIEIMNRSGPYRPRY